MDGALAWYEDEVTRATGRAWSAMMRRPFCRLYLWCRPGELRVAHEHPGDGFELVTPSPLPIDRTRDGIRAWVWEAARRAPCIPVE